MMKIYGRIRRRRLILESLLLATIQVLISSARKKSGDRNRSRLRVGLEQPSEFLHQRCTANFLAVTVDTAGGAIDVCVFYRRNETVFLANLEIGAITAQVDLTTGVVDAHPGVCQENLGLVAALQNGKAAA